MATLTNEERETHLNQTADDRSTWELFSDDPVMIARIDKLGIVGIPVGEGKCYTLDKSQVSIRKKRTPMSDEQREAAASRFAVALGRVDSE